MSLDYDLRAVKDHDTVCFMESDGKRILHPVTYFLIHHMISIMMTKIEESNVDEILLRTLMYRRANAFEGEIFEVNPSDWENPIHRKLTREDVIKHIGLSTNVTEEDRDYFIRRRVVRSMIYDANHEYGMTIK